MTTGTERREWVVEEYKRLLQRVKTDGANAFGRLKLAEDLYDLSQKSVSWPGLRLQILQQAACLDPHTAEYGQALASALKQFHGELRARVEATRDTPRERLALAAELFSIARSEISDRQVYLDLLQAAVQLDPFSTRYRLKLAQAEQEAGLVNQAIAEYRRALEFWPDSQQVNLLLGEALLDVGNVEEARTCLDKAVKGEGPLGLRAAYGKVECALREAKGEKDWPGVLDMLAELPPPGSDGAVRGVFLEKCLKAVVECDDPALRDKFVALARERGGTDGGQHPALGLVERAAQFASEPGFAPGSLVGDGHAQLGGLLQAYLLARKKPVSTAEMMEEWLNALNAWRQSVEKLGDQWPELRQGYLHVLDEWATQAYKNKSFGLAGTLWQEAARIVPYNPAVLQNLALVYTCLGDEEGYRWYWDAFTRAWTLHGEMMPQAEGYRRPLLQKHQAFADGARKKLNALQDPREALALGATWVQEAISYLTLQQLGFRNPCFRLGVMAEDWSDEAGCKAAVEAGHQSIHTWLSLMAAWQQLHDEARLDQWREQQLEDAHRAAARGGEARYRCYDEEIKEFRRHREQVIGHFLPLLFNVLMPAAERIDFDDEAARAQYASLAQGLLSFPHLLLKRGLVQVFEQQRETAPDRRSRQAMSGIIEAVEKDPEGLVRNYAVGPWLKRAQELMEQRKFQPAAALLEEMLRMAPDSAVGMFLLAQCQAAEEQFDQAYAVLQKATAVCRDKDLLQHIEKLAENIDVARVNKRLEKVQQYLKQENGQAAVRECQAALKEYPEHPYVLFVLGQSYLADADALEARETLERAQRFCQKDSELWKAIDNLLQQVKDHGPEIILSRAVPLMKDHKWDEAWRFLANGRKLKPPSARVTFYEAICLAQLGEVSEAEKMAQAALSQLKSGEAELRQEIEGFIPQIPLIRIQEQLARAKTAMEKERWSQALPHLEEAIRLAPKTVLPQFYQAICHFKLEQWDEAESTAKKALPLCGKGDEQIREQLQLMLEQISKVREAALLGPILEALKREEWRSGLTQADEFLRTRNSKHPIVLFYKAVCEFKLDQRGEAKSTAQKALEYATGSEYDSVRQQLNQIIEAASIQSTPMRPLRTLAEATRLASWTEDMNEAVQAMNRQEWFAAIPHLNKVLERDSTVAQAYYYRALCKHQGMMESINKGDGLKRETLQLMIMWFQGVRSDLEEAEHYRSHFDRDLGSAISKLLEAVDNVLDQLRRL